MEPFETPEEYRAWVESQDWYQSIELSCGVRTPGTFRTDRRLPVLERLPFQGKRVLDIGCNSGQYAMLAKREGAREVIGVDIKPERLEQGRILGVNEGLDVTFLQRDLFEIADLGQFDIVLCIAVLTEVTDFFGAVDVLRGATGEHLFLELDLAKPLFYLSRSRTWLRGSNGLPRRGAVAEVRRTTLGNLVVSPTLSVLREAFGPDFQVTRRGRGVRYDVVDVRRA